MWWSLWFYFFSNCTLWSGFSFAQVGRCTECVLPSIQPGLIHVIGRDLTIDFQHWEYHEENICHHLINNHLQHTRPADQCPRCCHCHSWHLHLLTGKPIAIIIIIVSWLSRSHHHHHDHFHHVFIFVFMLRMIMLIIIIAPGAAIIFLSTFLYSQTSLLSSYLSCWWSSLPISSSSSSSSSISAHDVTIGSSVTSSTDRLASSLLHVLHHHHNNIISIILIIIIIIVIFMGCRQSSENFGGVDKRDKKDGNNSWQKGEGCNKKSRISFGKIFKVLALSSGIFVDFGLHFLRYVCNKIL